MPIRTTYPNQFGGPGRVITDFGLIEETFQGYCQIPSVPTASVQLLDIDSPNPLSPVALTIPGSGTNNRAYLSIIGTIQSASGGSDITMSAAGTIKVAPTLTTDTSITGNATGASPRNNQGVLVSGASIPRGSVLVSGGQPGVGFTISGNTAGGLTFSVFGATNDSNTSTALNISSSVAARPAFVFVTIRTLIRKWRVQTIADYPDTPRAVRELLQITV